MRLLNRKSRLRRLVGSIGDSRDLPRGIKSSLPAVDSSKATRYGLLAAGGLAGLTAGSAAVSSARRRTKGSRDNR